MADTERIVIPGWVKAAVAALVSTVVGVIAVLVFLEGRFVPQKEHAEHEASDRREISRLDATLSSHIESTRLDGARLLAIEVQLQAVREDLRWLRENAARRQGRP